MGGETHWERGYPVRMENGAQVQERREKALYAGGVTFYGFILLVHFCWAISGPVTKMSYAGLGVSGTDVFELICFAGIRLLGAGVIGLSYCCARGVPLMPERGSDFWSLTKLGLIMGVAQYLFFNFGTALSSGVQTSILSSSGAFCGILISALVFREALTLRKITGCMLGVVAVVVLNWEDVRQGVAASLLGALLLILGQASGAAGAAYVKVISKGRNAIWVGGWQSVISGILLVVIGLCGGGALSFRGEQSAALLPTVALIVTSGAALIFSNQLYKYNPLSKVMIFSLLSPVFGVFSSAVMLGDPLHLGVFASLVINCAGVALVTTEKLAGEVAKEQNQP